MLAEVCDVEARAERVKELGLPLLVDCDGEKVVDVEADEHEVDVLIIRNLARVDRAVGIAPRMEQALVIARLLVALLEQPAADELVPACRTLLEAVDRLEHAEHERTPVRVAVEMVAGRSCNVDLLVEPL